MLTAISRHRSLTLAARAAAVVVFAGPRAASAQPTLTDLGVLPNGIQSHACAVSNPGGAGGPGWGGAVTGHCFTTTGIRAFVWTEADGMLGLPPFPGGSPASGGIAISPDSTVVVGYCLLVSQERPTRWTRSGTAWVAQNLGVLPGGSGNSTAQGVSANGLFVVGSSPSPGGPRAVGWDGSITDYGVMPGGTYTFGLGVSADGTVLVGEGDTPEGTRAFRWTATGGFQNLGTLTGGTYSFCGGVSADGETVVGTGDVDFQQRAWRYDDQTGRMTSLGVLTGGFNSSAAAVSGDGSTIVGRCDTPTGPRAVLWTQDVLKEDLNNYLGALGVDLTGWTLERAEGISPDGSAIAGTARRNNQTRAFLVTGLPSCRPGIESSMGASARCPGRDAEYVVNVTPDSGPVVYAWRKDGVAIDSLLNPSAATNHLVIADVTPEDEGTYDCVISNACGSTTGPAFPLDVLPPDDPTCACPADTDGDGVLNSADFFAFLLFFFNGVADFNNDGVTNSQDFFEYLVAFFLGC